MSMVRRWLIRVPCLGALAFVVAVWGASYFAGVHLYEHSGFHSSIVDVAQGRVCVAKYGDINESSPDSPLRIEFTREMTFRGWRLSRLPWVPTTLGFSAGRIRGDPDSFVILFPLWLPTGMLSALCWIVWRKTRGKAAGRGFPVEATLETGPNSGGSPRTV